MVANLENIQVVYSEIPKRWNINGEPFFNYSRLTDRHYEDGWRNVELPALGNFQRLADEYILVDDVVTKEIVNFSDAEIAEIYELKIIEKYQYLMLRALSSSMGKYGGYEYLQLQKLEYDEKYKVAKGLLFCQPIADAIENEMLRDFSDFMLTDILTSYGITPAVTQIDKMYQLIIFRYEYAENRYNIFKGFCIDFRTKCRTLIEQLEWSKLDTAFNLVDTLPQEVTDTEIQQFYDSFNAL